MSQRPSRFRATGAFAFLLIATACSGIMSLDKAREAVIIDAGGAKLTGKTLEAWLLQLPVVPTEQRAAFTLSAWTDAALLTKAVRGGESLDDSASVDAVIRPDAARGSSLEYWQGRAAKRPPITDAQADSLADEDRVRVFQHIVLRATRPASDTAAFNALRGRARGIAQRAQAGENFAALVKEASQDSTTRLTGGFLPASTRDQIPGQLAPILWALKPGEISPSVLGPYGMEIFRRASRAESRPGLRAWLPPQMGRVLDSIYVDSMMRAHPYTIGANAIVRARSASKEPVMSPKPADDAPFATWDGGSLTASNFRMWLMMLSPGERAQMSAGSDTTVSGYIKGLVQREMVLAVAAPGGIPTPKGREVLGPQYKRSLDSAKAVLKRTSNNLAPAEAASAYIDALLAGKLEYRPLPGMLSGVLRMRSPVVYDLAALKSLIAHVSIEWKVKHAADSTTVGGGASPAKAPKDSGTP